MITSPEFDEKLEELLSAEITRQIKESFAETLAGDWDGDIKELLSTLRSKSKDQNIVDYLVLYLFSELVNEGRIIFTETTYSGDDYTNKVFTPDSCEGNENKIFIYSYAKDKSLQIMLKDD